MRAPAKPQPNVAQRAELLRERALLDGGSFDEELRRDEIDHELRLCAAEREPWYARQVRSNAPLKPGVWAKTPFRSGYVEIMSMPWIEDDPGAWFGEWVIMVRRVPGDPGTLTKLRARTLSTLQACDSDWAGRPRWYYEKGCSDVWIWRDELKPDHPEFEPWPKTAGLRAPLR